MTNNDIPPISLLAVLERMGACLSSRTWVKTRGGKTFAETWNKCRRPDWMRYLLRGVGVPDAWAQTTEIGPRGYVRDKTPTQIRKAFPAAQVERLLALYALEAGLVPSLIEGEPLSARPNGAIRGTTLSLRGDKRKRTAALYALEAERRGLSVEA